MQKALRTIARKHAIISRNITFIPMHKLAKTFIPSIIKDGKDRIQQEVHVIFKNGEPRENVCKHNIFIKDSESSFEKGKCIEEVLKTMHSVDKVVITICDSKDMQREMIVYG